MLSFQDVQNKMKNLFFMVFLTCKQEETEAFLRHVVN